MDDNSGAQDSSNYTDTYESNSYSFNNETENTYDRSNDYSNVNDCSADKNISSSADDDDFIAGKHCLPPEVQEVSSPSQDELDTFINIVQNDSGFDNTSVQKNESLSNINQDTLYNEQTYNNEYEHDSDCCACGNGPLTCFVFFCDCFGL